jgi:hypothetical protein
MKEPISASGKGMLVARTLAGSWRRAGRDSFQLSQAELDEVTPLLYGSGGAALGWWRVRETELRSSPSAEVLHQAYQLQVLQSGIHEQKIQKVFRLLRAESIEPILVKGWSAARFYPDQALRPYGDIDICVQPNDFRAAEIVLARPEANDCWVDLHKRFEEIGERSVEELLARSRLVDLNDEKIRILSPEDHLALLAIHLLKHGAWRPLWLCDIGAAVESVSSDFDWSLCLGRNKKKASWIICVIGLANLLLDAEIDHLTFAKEARELPGWLVATVLKQWNAPFSLNQPPMSHPEPMANYLFQPRGLLRALRKRWPDPIMATVSVNGRFTKFPRWPYQLGNWGSRIGLFLLRLPRLSRAK